ncbi:MAG: NUDIX hydrolase [Fusobacteriota bacterium]
MNGIELEKVKKNLPECPDVMGKEEHYFNSAVAISLIKIDDEYNFLFQKRAKNIRQAGEICFPGGKYEEYDKNYEETAVRETMEELGLDRSNIEVLGPLDTVVAAMGATIDSFLIVLKVDSIKDLQINKAEVAEIFTVPVSYFENNPPEKYEVRLEIHPHYFDKDGNKKILFPAEDLGFPEYSKPWGGRRHNVYVYKVDGRVIWGITAQLVKEVINKLEG